MDWVAASLWGVAGGASLEAVDIIKSVRWHRQMPWNVQPDTIDPPQARPNIRPGEERLPAPGWKAYCVVAVLRLFVSGAPTAALTASFPNSINPLVAFLVGAGALTFIEQGAALVPLVVKGAGRAALGSVVDAAQQPLPQQEQQPGAAQPNGLPPAQPNSAPSQSSPAFSGNARPDLGVAAQQDPSSAGGAA
jgi:hypothetical protein